MVEDDLERVADMADLPPVASDIVENGALGLRARRLSQVDVEQTDLRTLLVEGQRIDRLPKLLRRK